MRKTILFAVCLMAIAVVVIPWHARRSASRRLAKAGEDFDVQNTTGCDFVPVTSLTGGSVLEALRKGLVVHQREAQPTEQQVERLADRVMGFIGFHHAASPGSYPAFRLPMASGPTTYGDLDPGYAEELRQPEKAVPLRPADIERARARLPRLSDPLLQDVILNYAMRLQVAEEVGGAPCTNCVGALCLPSLKAAVLRSPTGDPGAMDVSLGLPSHGSPQVFRQWYVVRPTAEDLVKASGVVQFAHVALMARSGPHALPLVLVYYWEPGRADWVLCEVTKGNSAVRASFIL
jgi:hypothetical protein